MALAQCFPFLRHCLLTTSCFNYDSFLSKILLLYQFPPFSSITAFKLLLIQSILAKHHPFNSSLSIPSHMAPTLLLFLSCFSWFKDSSMKNLWEVLTWHLTLHGGFFMIIVNKDRKKSHFFSIWWYDSFI